MNRIEIKNKTCPVRDNIWVELMSPKPGYRAVRYDTCRVVKLAQHHIAYQPVGGHSLRHAGFRRFSFFYPYSVPTGQEPFVNQTTNDIVKAHGGRIEITSTPGKGSTFIIQLPK